MEKPTNMYSMRGAYTATWPVWCVIGACVSGIADGKALAEIAPKATDAVSAISAAHVAIDADLGKKDTDSIVRMCTADFRHIYQDGRVVQMPQYVKDTQKQFRRADTLASATQVTSVTPTADGADDVIKQRITAIAPYKILFVRRRAHVTIDYVIAEHWVRDLSGGWLLQQSRTMSEKQDIKP